jgi:hypothetical protein
MARAVPGFHNADFAIAQLTHDVERMSPQLMRLYLERRLEAVESRIHALSNHLDAVEQRAGLSTDWRWSAHPVTEERWTFLADLSYCVAARDALKTVISAL